jgi:hypothetical protein
MAPRERSRSTFFGPGVGHGRVPAMLSGMVDPLARTLEVLRLDGSTYRLVSTWRDEAVVRADPFDAVELNLGSLWAR